MNRILPSTPPLTYEATEKIFMKVWSYMSVDPRELQPEIL